MTSTTTSTAMTMATTTTDNPPATNIHAIVKTQIVFLFSTLTEDNFERNQMEILSVCFVLLFI
jgi:hypothetical protein